VIDNSTLILMPRWVFFSISGEMFKAAETISYNLYASNNSSDNEDEEVKVV